MGRFPISESKEQELLNRMKELDVREEDLVEKFIRGSGKGGQKINKTSNCVYLLHEPSGIEIKCQQDRSQALNRFLARRELCDKLEEQQRGVRSKKQQEFEKIRRQKRRRSRRQKEKMLDDKKKHGQKKERRRPVPKDES